MRNRRQMLVLLVALAAVAIMFVVVCPRVKVAQPYECTWNGQPAMCFNHNGNVSFYWRVGPPGNPLEVGPYIGTFPSGEAIYLQ